MFKTVDVAIGVVLLYLLVTLVASVILELISTTHNWRAEMLHDAIENMLGKADSALLSVGDIYGHPLVLALCRSAGTHSWIDFMEKFGWKGPAENTGTPPSYMPPA